MTCCPASYETKSTRSNPRERDPAAGRASETFVRASLTGLASKTYRCTLMGSVRSRLIALSVVLRNGHVCLPRVGRKERSESAQLVSHGGLEREVPMGATRKRRLDKPAGRNLPPGPPGRAGQAGFPQLDVRVWALVLAPRIPMVADTAGFGGFQLSAELGLTEISNHQSFWNGVEAVSPNNPTQGPRPDPC